MLNEQLSQRGYQRICLEYGKPELKVHDVIKTFCDESASAIDAQPFGVPQA